MICGLFTQLQNIFFRKTKNKKQKNKIKIINKKNNNKNKVKNKTTTTKTTKTKKGSLQMKVNENKVGPFISSSIWKNWNTMLKISI